MTEVFTVHAGVVVICVMCDTTHVDYAINFFLT